MIASGIIWLIISDGTRHQIFKESFMRKMVIGFLILFSVQFFAFAQDAEVYYRVHMSGIGWSGYSSNGETAGTTGQSRQLEAIRIRVDSSVAGSIRYNAYVQNAGWLGWAFDNEDAGTTGQNRRMEAIRIQLTGQLAAQFDVRYRVHMADVGWSGWALNGDVAGTTGQSRRIEAIQVRLEPK